MFSLFEFCHLVSSPGKLSLSSVHSHYRCTLRPFIFVKRGGLKGIKAQSSSEGNITKMYVCVLSHHVVALEEICRTSLLNLFHFEI